MSSAFSAGLSVAGHDSWGVAPGWRWDRAYGGTDVDLITGGETSPHVTQSETFTWANPDKPNNIIVTYNDSYRCKKFSKFLRKKS